MSTDQSVSNHSVAVDNLICTGCGTTYYSAAAESMVARGERCDCGCLLRVVGGKEVPEVPVGGPPEAPASGATVPLPKSAITPLRGPRRFTRD